MEQDVYDCENKYLDIAKVYKNGTYYWSAKCVEKTACTRILADFANVCLTEYACIDFPLNYFGYLYTNGNIRECVNASSCKAKGWFAYENIKECRSMKPDLVNGNFIESYDVDSVYRCQYN